VPVLSPDLGAAAMSAVNEGVNAHVSAMPDVPTPVAGARRTCRSLSPRRSCAAVDLEGTLVAEGSRLKALLARVGGPVSGG